MEFEDSNMITIKRQHFRILLAASLLCLFSWIAAGMTQSLPEPLATYANAQMNKGVTPKAIFDLIALAGILLSYIGLFSLQRWGRTLFIAATIILTFLTLFDHPVIVTANANVLSSIGDMLTGAIIAIALFTPLFDASGKA
jgi:hypothetical protein